MIEELTEEVQQLFPNETKVSPSLLAILYSTAKLNHAKQLVATMNEIRNQELREYLLNVVSITPIIGNIFFRQFKSIKF